MYIHALLSIFDISKASSRPHVVGFVFQSILTISVFLSGRFRPLTFKGIIDTGGFIFTLL